MTGAADENIFILHSAINISVILHFASQLHFYPPPASCQTCVAPSEIEIIQCTCMKYKFCSLPAANYNSIQQLLVIVGFLYLYSRSVWKIIMIFIYLLFFLHSHTRLDHTMNRIQNGWFSEVNDQWPGQALSLEVDEILFEGKSKHQDILVFKRYLLGLVNLMICLTDMFWFCIHFVIPTCSS